MIVASSIVLEPSHPSYPAALRDLGKHPPTLYVRGALPRLPGVAIVGRREASPEALEFTRSLVQDLASAELSIWSGGARGVDAAAHEAALVSGAPTVVVTGAGLDHPYPYEHAPLFARVLAAGGALVSRLPDDRPPRPNHFLARNQVLAAMTVGLVVIEAGLQSGARSAAAAARRLQRPLCVVPHPPWSERGRGAAEELAMGARAITCAEDVLRAIGARNAARRRASPARPLQPSLPFEPVPSGLGPVERAVLGLLNNNPMHMDVICATLGEALPVVAGALLTLTLQAVVVEGPAGSYRRVKS